MGTIEGRFLIDTNVLIYATLADDPRSAIARGVMLQRQQPGREAFVSAQNLAEMYPNLTGPKTQPPDTPAQARLKVQAIARLPGLTVLPVTAAAVEGALEIAADVGAQRQRFYDMQLAALMQLHDVPLIVTEDEAGFRGINGVRVFNPFA